MTGTGTAHDALGVRLPAPGWLVLDAVRHHRFTGEATLIGFPAVRLWADQGRIYRAELVDGPPLPAQLVANQVIAPGELARGVVHVAGREHLGALFERSPRTDRYAVTVAVAALTEEALRAVAAQQLAAVEIVPYAFDPAGVHQWFSAADTPEATVPQPFAAPPVDAVPASAPPPAPPPESPPASGAPAGEAIDWDSLPYLEGLSGGASNGSPPVGEPAEAGFSVIWPDGDRRPAGTGVTVAPAAARPTTVSAGTRARLLDDRFADS